MRPRRPVVRQRGRPLPPQRMERRAGPAAGRSLYGGALPAGGRRRFCPARQPGGRGPGQPGSHRARGPPGLVPRRGGHLHPAGLVLPPRGGRPSPHPAGAAGHLPRRGGGAMRRCCSTSPLPRTGGSPPRTVPRWPGWAGSWKPSLPWT